MGKAFPPFNNRGPVQVTSISTAITPAAPTDIPIGWIQVQTVGSGGLVVKDQGGTSRTYSGLIAGQTLYGPFTEITSMTLSKILYGDGPAPPYDAGLALGALYTNAQSTQGLVELRAPASFYLLTGAPLAIFADGASAVPGSNITDSKTACVRWNNHAAPAAILASFRMPPDCDTAANMIVHVRAAKTGATSGDAVTFDIGCFNQVDGALEDADTDFGGTSSAMTGAATAKTVQNVTLTLAAANLANPQTAPASVTLTIKPTAGTLGTDDLCLIGVDIYYTKKLLPS